ncbi:MAG: hypothetical protein U9Q81_07340 [Pseudomonadota bacterium]|nr:hypothetical protein [Pseudomonadota bacterium]
MRLQRKGDAWDLGDCEALPRWRPALASLLLLAGSQGAASSPCVSGRIDPSVLSATSLEARIQSAPPAITALALRRNLGNGVAVEPRAASMDHPLVPALFRMLSRLPSPLYRLARETVAAIYLLQDNFGSARVEALRDPHGHLSGGCILLNLDALSRPANAWASWRENSAFRADEPYAVRVILEPRVTDTVESTLRFIFLHELGHVLGMAAGVHGFWAAPETWWLTVQSPYFQLSWARNKDTLTSEWKRRFSILEYPRFYRFEAAPLPLAAAPVVYGALARTNWPSLYGSIDPYEDFAETFALFVHTRLLGGSYRVDVLFGPERVAHFLSCLDTGRCPGKTAYLEQLFTRFFGESG